MAQHYTARALRWRTIGEHHEAKTRYGTYRYTFESDDEACWHQEVVCFDPTGSAKPERWSIALDITEEVKALAQAHYQELHAQHCSKRQQNNTQTYLNA
jgi:hypothetical protein